eukprot:GFUD01027745.1.p1 GENE.GFUD01027745.1~~GFUD01027745.1.p1  ORF type:complete len:210 (+),score=58.98 GFUD01027745.1:11-640(+)
MFKHIYLFSVIFAAAVVQSADPSVKLTVYYESLCGDSINFVLTQLYPNWQHFGEDLKIDFKPFGKADFMETGSSWNFTCQHGPEECVGNKFQACLLNQVPEPEENVPLIHCFMSQIYEGATAPEAAEGCLSTLEITTTTNEKVEECAESDEGSNLLHDLGVETKNLDPKLYFVPWVLFNDVFDDQAWQGGLDDLREVLCTSFLAGSSKC